MINNIKDKLLVFISNNFSTTAVTKFSFSTPLISSGRIDSFGLIDLSLFIEDEFKVEIHDTELNAATFDNIDQLANLIWTRQSRNQKN
ncbi:MAG: hypothetical protein HZB50_14835 [Chloroflexi bacterium]|nr:hypothetical protein [Chloroflexota bacterium]